MGSRKPWQWTINRQCSPTECAWRHRASCFLQGRGGSEAWSPVGSGARRVEGEAPGLPMGVAPPFLFNSGFSLQPREGVFLACLLCVVG